MNRRKPMGRGPRAEAHGPLFSVGEEVAFETEHHSLTGRVEIVGHRGRESNSFDGCDWSYDVFVESHPGCNGGPHCTSTYQKAE